MKKRFIPAAFITAAVALTAVAASKSDPTVMTVNGKAIPLSEFSYLYNKNNSQQVEPTTVDKYVDMFTVYKLKVADAEANGIDTTQNFLKEFTRYRDELAAPYMTDNAVEDSLVAEIYEHMKTNRDVNYIMMFGGRSAAERAANKARLDSVRNEIVNNHADFGEMADKYSVDKNHGRMGFMKANKYPYDFEKAVYDTPIGEVSEVQEFPFGFFIVRIDGERQDPGQVSVRHILKLTRNMNDEQRAAVKDKIDSIYNVVKDNPKLFPGVAMKESQDPGSAKKGGALPWFGSGEMVKEFEQMAFALPDDAISEPVQTSYGWHIIQKLGSKGTPSLEDARQAIVDNIKHDRRATMAADKRLAQYRAEYGGKVEGKVLASVKKSLEGFDNDTTALQSLAADNRVIAKLDKGKVKITVAEVAAKLAAAPASMTDDNLSKRFADMTETALNDATREYALEKLSDKYPDYKNLINEYRDGMLLFEVSNRNVWDRSTKDREGLEKFFNDHKARYMWTKAHYKGYVVFAPNDSVLSLARELVDSKKGSTPEEISKALRVKFGKNIKVQQVLAAEGENPITDNIAFGGPEPALNKQWPCFFDFDGKIIAMPGEAADVRGAVTADYQQMLEDQWVRELRSKYPVSVNRDALKGVADNNIQN